MNKPFFARVFSYQFMFTLLKTVRTMNWHILSHTIKDTSLTSSASTYFFHYDGLIDDAAVGI